MADAAFPTAKYPAYTTDQLRAFIVERGNQKFTLENVNAIEAMQNEIARRDRVAAGDVSVMTPGERLRHARKET